MRHLKRIAVLLIALSLTTVFAEAAKKESTSQQSQSKPDATIRLSSGSFAVGIGFSWGKGTLTYKGKDYPLSVNGLSLGKVGISGATASGEVYNLKNIKDFDGNYTAAGIGITLAGGRSGVAMKNQNGVKVVVASTTKGFDVTIGGGGVTMKLKK